MFYWLDAPPTNVRREPYERQARVQSVSKADGRSFNFSLLEKADGPLSPAELQSFTSCFEFEFPPVPGQKLDFLGGADGGRLVSGRVRDRIEALEPGAHQFIEWELIASPKILKMIDDPRFYFIHCYRRHDFIDIERSWVEIPKLGTQYQIAFSGQDKLVAKTGWRPPGHLWMSIRGVVSMCFFVSQQLKDSLDEIEAGPIHYWPVATT